MAGRQDKPPWPSNYIGNQEEIDEEIADLARESGLATRARRQSPLVPTSVPHLGNLGLSSSYTRRVWPASHLRSRRPTAMSEWPVPARRSRGPRRAWQTNSRQRQSMPHISPIDRISGPGEPRNDTDHLAEESEEVNRVRLAAEARSREIEQQIEGVLVDGPPLDLTPGSDLEGREAPAVPPQFKKYLDHLRVIGTISRVVYEYYLNLGRRDTHNAPGQHGRESWLPDILTIDGVKRSKTRTGLGWKLDRFLGGGGQGEVMLWEKQRPGKKVSNALLKRGARILIH